jgi:sarcosine oxidase gamma subunit
MSDTRADMDRSIEATKAELAKLSPAQIDQVLDQTRVELEAFIKNEWLVLSPSERLAAAKRRAAAEFFHASVRVHDFGWVS